MAMNDESIEHNPVRSDASSQPYLLPNPRGVRKAPRKERPYDHKPTLHAPSCGSLARTAGSKPVEVPTITLRLFDHNEAWYCRNCLV